MRIRKSLLLLTAGVALSASAAFAQDGAPYNGPPAPYYGPPPEEVIVTSPRHGPMRSEIGAPIIEASLSRPVRIDDLDLRSDWGVHRLRDRISFAATSLCRQLNAMYPVSYDGASDSNCYRDAYDGAMTQADAAISQARGGYYGGY